MLRNYLLKDAGSNDSMNTSIINAPISLDLKINTIPKIQISNILTTMNQPLNMNDSNIINLNELNSTSGQPLIINTTGTAGQFVINNYGLESFSIFKGVCYIPNGLILNNTIQMKSNSLDGVKKIFGDLNVDVEIDTTGTGNLILKNNLVEKIKITSTSTDLYRSVNVPTTLIVNTKNILNEINNRYTKAEIDSTLTTLTSQTLLIFFYTKTEIDTKLNLKLNASVIDSYYNKSAIDSLLISKLNASVIENYYIKSVIDSLLISKLNASVIDSYYTKSVSDINYYYKAQVDTLLNAKLNITSPTATITTINNTTLNTTGTATVGTLIASSINSSGRIKSYNLTESYLLD